jgi:hypothetical protein
VLGKALFAACTGFRAPKRRLRTLLVTLARDPDRGASLADLFGMIQALLMQVRKELHPLHEPLSRVHADSRRHAKNTRTPRCAEPRDGASQNECSLCEPVTRCSRAAAPQSMGHGPVRHCLAASIIVPVLQLWAFKSVLR